MRRGVRLGIDVGDVRVGVATCDPDGMLATPVATLTRTPGAETAAGSGDAPSATDADIVEIAALAAESQAIEIVVGLPLLLSGEQGSAALKVRQYALVLAGACRPVEVRLVDERLTSVDAHRGLRESGVAGKRQRAVVDQAAAVLILQTALDLERSSGRAPGESVGGKRRKPRTKDRTG